MIYTPSHVFLIISTSDTEYKVNTEQTMARLHCLKNKDKKKSVYMQYRHVYQRPN